MHSFRLANFVGFFASDGTGSNSIPTGVAIACDAGCGHSLSVSHTVTHSLIESYSSSASLVITNVGNISLSGSLWFEVSWTAFNIGGAGISIDNARQSASFTSSSDTSGTPPGIGDDFHSCSVPEPGFPTDLSCSVDGADASEADLLVDLSSLAPGDSVEFDNTLTISDSFSIPTPEPSGLAILGAAIFAIALSRRRLAS